MNDFSEITKLAADLRDTGELVQAMKATVVKSATNIALTARAAAPRGPHTPKFADSIKARAPRETDSMISVSVEPIGGKQAKLGAILEFGTATSGPHPVLGNALHDEEPVFFSKMEDVAGRFVL